MGLEPTTFTLETCEHRTEGPQPQELTSGTTNACTNACTDGAEIDRSNPPKRPTATAVDAATAVNAATAVDATAADVADGAGERFAGALAMLAALPLTDAEKAEAVRRLLADLNREGDTAKTGGKAAPLRSTTPGRPDLPDGTLRAPAGRGMRTNRLRGRKRQG